MKLSTAEAGRFLAAPSPAAPGFLIYGTDPMRVAIKRAEAIAAIIGPEGEAEMRLTRMSGADLRRDGALLADAIKATGFFPGPRLVFVEEAGDGLAPLILQALASWKPGDAQVLVTAGQLAAKSALRKLFEAHPAAPCIAIYDDPPGQAEIEAQLKKAGLREISPAAMRDLMALGRALDPGDFRQTLEKIGLYKWGDQSPLASEDVAACAPSTVEAEVDDVLHAAAEGRMSDVATLMRRLEAQGIAPVTLAIRTLQHFRALHAAATDPGGAASGMAKLRPPVFGPRRDRMLRQVQNFRPERLEEALGAITDTDLTLRSSTKAPTMALVERLLLRLSALARAR
ncbi:DNA polymerase III subunit delta [Falsigemmobacter faecalis]|uniref:DNA-directed DNA polymerase n=1 Tax=Falsigemmobacter faecalis TaxID=2488730 RepID=A0A3P3DMQ5_9RHOB|nr:DNA polymerase III subunit delta [Falsigemmobacter faecalis]RRH75550.1 DNA polymerase III subunit delta [Falsigemmobacter faecalis]